MRITGVIVVRSAAQKAMLERCAADPEEARRRGMTSKMAAASLAAHAAGPGGPLPERLGAVRLNRHGKR